MIVWMSFERFLYERGEFALSSWATHSLGSVLQIYFHRKPKGYEATTLGSIYQL